MAATASPCTGGSGTHRVGPVPLEERDAFVEALDGVRAMSQLGQVQVLCGPFLGCGLDALQQKVRGKCRRAGRGPGRASEGYQGACECARGGTRPARGASRPAAGAGQDMSPARSKSPKSSRRAAKSVMTAWLPGSSSSALAKEAAASSGCSCSTKSWAFWAYCSAVKPAALIAAAVLARGAPEGNDRRRRRTFPVAAAAAAQRWNERRGGAQ